MLCAACWRTISDESVAVCPECGQATLLDGRYRLDKKLGEGATGVTFAATRVADGLAVCVKGLAFRGMSSLDAERLFRREARVLEQIRHPQVPAYIDDFTAGAGPSFALYLVQELVVGHDLEAERQARRRTVDEVCDTVDELLGIVEHLHRLAPPVVHRDIKPRNVMRRAADGRLVLVDFGAVKDAVHASLSAGLSVQGTFGYMAPEQLRGGASGQSDLYAIGMLAVALLSGREPADMIDGDTVGWQRHVAVRTTLVDWLEGMTEREPEARFADATEARQALREARQREHVPPGAREPGRVPDEARASEVPPRSSPEHPIPAPSELVAFDTSQAPAARSRWFPIVFGVVMLSLLVLGYRATRDEAPSQALVAPPPSPCAGACRPISSPFKEGLRFGMSFEEAKAARADVARAVRFDASLRDGLDLARLDAWRVMRRELAGPEIASERYCMDATLIDHGAICCLDFAAQRLGRLACLSDEPLELDAIEAMVATLERTYGRAARPAVGPAGSYLRRIASAGWHDATAKLELEFERGQDMALFSTRVVVVQTASAFASSIEDAHAAQARAAAEQRARAEEEARRVETERKRRREEEREKLGLPPDPL